MTSSSVRNEQMRRHASGTSASKGAGLSAGSGFSMPVCEILGNCKRMRSVRGKRGGELFDEREDNAWPVQIAAIEGYSSSSRTHVRLVVARRTASRGRRDNTACFAH